MNCLERYLEGFTEEVCEELLKQDYRTVLPEAEKVYAELFRRVRFNLETIHAELERSGYKFYRWQNTETGYDNLMPPLSKAEIAQQLATIEEKGLYMPLSLQVFYQYVGGCNFGWDYNNFPDIPWYYSDPIQVSPPANAIEDFMEWFDDFKENREEFGSFEEFLDDYGLTVSADFYHKDGVSGGKPYAVKVSESPCIDNLLMYEENNTSFINYLRICFDGCGFSRAYQQEDNEDFQAFCKRVKPKLLKI